MRQPISKKKERENKILTALVAAGAGEGGPARRGADAGAAATSARSSWARAPAIRAITRTSRVMSFILTRCAERGERGRREELGRRDEASHRQWRFLEVLDCVTNKEKDEEKKKN